MLVWLILDRMIPMITKGNNSILSFSSAFIVDDGPELKYNETRMLMYHVIRKQTNDEPVYVNG